MIKFFRKIRRKLLSENKFSKYLIYAIGEIILVVIGILIALQINNWNENRILLSKENHYLIEISTNLETDIARINDIFDLNQVKDSLLDVTISPLLTFKLDSEIAKTIARNFEPNSIFNLFEQNNLGFRNMTQAESIGLIQNDSLRQKLTFYYRQDEELKTGTASRIRELTREYSDISTKIILNKETITQITGRENNWPLNIELGREDKTILLSYLINIKDNTSYYNTRLKNAQEEAQDLRNSINKYLNE